VHHQGRPEDPQRQPVHRPGGQDRSGRSTRDHGVTLVELLVVILVLGVLASIALPAFSGYRERAVDAALQSDLKGISVAAMTAALETGRFPTAADELDDGGGVAISAGNTVVLFSGADGYVLFGTAAGLDRVWVLSSYDGAAPRPAASLTSLPTTGPAAGTFGASQPDLGGSRPVLLTGP
jgi:type IV pilus assembly protein PilA